MVQLMPEDIGDSQVAGSQSEQPKRGTESSRENSPALTTALTRARQLHVESIIRIMRDGQWVRGKSGPLYAQANGLGAQLVRDYAAEAWRSVCREVTDPKKVTDTIAANLAARLSNADDKDASRLADVWSRVVGARAPERHEVAMVVAEFDRLPREGKLAWLDERIAALTEARDALLTAPVEVEGNE